MGAEEWAMTDSTDFPAAEGAGLLLPPGVVQPLDLRVLIDDLHVMAWFSGHPAYEAVEAMIRYRAGQAPFVRAILTRHDQSQVDHLNDETVVAMVRRAGGLRETVHADVRVVGETVDGLPQAQVEFISASGERVELLVRAATRPDARYGGLTDPGNHSLTGSLPVMVRGRSSKAGVATLVKIDGVSYQVPELAGWSPDFRCVQGVYTEHHQMGLVRSGSRSCTVVQEPQQIALGSAWRHEMADGERLAWQVREQVGDRVLVESESPQRRERVKAQVRGPSLLVHEIECLAPACGPPGFVIRFPDAGRFALSLGSARDLITGSASCQQQADGVHVLSLQPREPAWAERRPVEVSMERCESQLRLSCRIAC